MNDIALAWLISLSFLTVLGGSLFIFVNLDSTKNKLYALWASLLAGTSLLSVILFVSWFTDRVLS